MTESDGWGHDGGGDGEEPISPREAAAYISDLCGEMAGMARRVGLARTAKTLEMARQHAADDAIDGAN